MHSFWFEEIQDVIKGKIAVLTPNEVVCTIANLILTLAIPYKIDFKVFTDIKKAKKWLGVI